MSKVCTVLAFVATMAPPVLSRDSVDAFYSAFGKAGNIARKAKSTKDPVLATKLNVQSRFAYVEAAEILRTRARSHVTGCPAWVQAQFSMGACFENARDYVSALHSYSKCIPFKKVAAALRDDEGRSLLVQIESGRNRMAMNLNNSYRGLPSFKASELLKWTSEVGASGDSLKEIIAYAVKALENIKSQSKDPAIIKEVDDLYLCLEGIKFRYESMENRLDRALTQDEMDKIVLVGLQSELDELRRALETEREAIITPAMSGRKKSSKPHQ